MTFLRVLGWIFIPYIMIFVQWKRLKSAPRIIGGLWAVIAALSIVLNVSTIGTTSSPHTKVGHKAAVDPFAPQFHPEISAVAQHGGVGDSFAQMQKMYGRPTRVNQAMSGGVGQYNYQNDLEVVSYESGRVGLIQFQIDNKPLTMTAAKSVAMKLLPADATFLRQEDRDANTRTYFYRSKALVPLFAKIWTEDPNGKPQPGVCTTQLIHTGDRVTSFGAAVGASP